MLLLTIVALLSLAGVARGEAPAAHPFTLKGLDGEKLSLEALSGKVVLLLFLSDRCGACLEELPRVIEIRERYRDKGFEVVGILTEEPAPASAVREATFPLVMANEKVKEAYRVLGTPLHYLLDRNHTIQAKHRGYSAGRERILESEVRALIGGEDLNESGMNLYLATGSWEGHFVPGQPVRPRTDQITPLLNSPMRSEREWAIEELGRRRAVDAAAMLGSILVSKVEPISVRRKALAALVEIASEDSLGSLLRLARDRGAPPLLRGEAVWALAGFPDSEAAEELLIALLRDPDPNVRLRSARAAAATCLRKAEAEIGEVLEGEGNPWVASGLREALERLGGCPGGAVSDAPPSS